MAAGMSVLLVATLMPATAAGRSPERFGRVDTGGRTPNTDALAMNRDPNATVSVIVQFAGQPVAAAAGAALEAGRELSEAEKASLRQGLITRQANLKTQLRTIGARVEGSYTDVLNGVRITVKASEIQRIRDLAGVIKVEPTPTHFRGNTNTVEYLRADKAWERADTTGDGVVIAVIDDGINYYHSHFDGTGVQADYTSDSGLNRSGGTFPTDKVIEGHDFVGEDYDPSDPLNDEPDPDNDPLTCKDPDATHHGTHVAGTAAGVGVRQNGTAYTGSYDEDTLDDTNFLVGPGTAPEASILAYRVFGCSGGTTLVVDAIERAVRDGADVINMSLGGPFGNPGSADALAVDNASTAGVTVVMSAGNSGPSAYITGTPGVATRGISVAAMDAVPSFPSVVIDMATGADIVGILANGETDGLPLTGELNVFEDNPATLCDEDTGEGCEEAGTHADSYIFNGYVAGQIPVTFRGNGARVDRAIQGDMQGAPAVIMVNNSTSLPPFEGPINGADIPFVGVRATDAPRFFTDEGEDATLSEGAELANENFKHSASFTSGGPRRIDSMLKPDVTAPGVGVFSADGGRTRGGKILSGTSMSSPAVAGVAALVLEANPSWNSREVKAALIGTASPGRVDPYDARLSGSGVVNPKKAAEATSLVFTEPGVSSLVFGSAQISGSGDAAYSETRSFNVINRSSTSKTYQLSNTFSTDTLGAEVSISPSTLTVPANNRKTASVTIEFSRGDARAMPDVAPFHGPDLAFDDFGQLHSPLSHVAGALIASPTSSGNSIRIPWLVAPRGISRLNDQPKSAYTESPNRFKTTTRVTNYGLHSGIADVYQWGILDDNDGLDGIDIRAAGVQSLDPTVCDSMADPDDECLVFAINTWNDWNNASENQFDVLIDTDGDDAPDYLVVGIDLGLILGAFSGVYGSIVVDLSIPPPLPNITALYFATAPNNGASMLLPALASDLGLDSTDDTFSYIVESSDVYDGADDLFQFDQATTSIHPSNGSEWAHYTAFDPVLSNGQFVPLDPKESADITLRVEKDGYDPDLGHKGWMIVTLEDQAGGDSDGENQADLISVGRLP